MAIKTLKLNSMQVGSAKPKDKEYSLSDGDGLYLRVRKSGTKQWIFNYYHPITKKKKNISYGSYPDITLAKARSLAENDRKLLKNKQCPKEVKDSIHLQALKEYETTFESVAAEWLALHEKKVAPTTYKKIHRYFEKDVLPFIGKYPVTQITAPLGISIIKKVSGRGSYEIARKVSRAMNQVMNYAVNTGYVPHNPLIGIKEAIPYTQVQNRPTIAVDEITELMTALRYSSAKVTTRCLIEFQLHTMTRPREAAEARWSEISLDNMLWVIPASRMKMGREHKIPLTKQVVELLEVMRPFSGNREYVFPSHNKPKSPVNAQTANKALRDMGFTGRLVAHGLRALASTTLNEYEFDDDVIETALAHGDQNKIRKAYNRAEYLEKRRLMMQWWSNRIEQAKTGTLNESPALTNLHEVNFKK